jgi:hypothetical protein
LRFEGIMHLHPEHIGIHLFGTVDAKTPVVAGVVLQEDVTQIEVGHRIDV